MLGNGFGHTVEDAFEIMYFAGVLDFDDDDFVFAVLCFDVDTVELVVGTLLIPFAFEDFKDSDLFPEHDGQETVEHTEVGLLAQQALDCPIETDIPVLQLLSFNICHGFRI